VYAPQNDSTEYPIQDTYEITPAKDRHIIDDFAGEPGFYSLTVHSRSNGSIEVASFNSFGDAVGSRPLQYEVVVTRDGGVWVNLGESGDPISIPNHRFN